MLKHGLFNAALFRRRRISGIAVALIILGATYLLLPPLYYWGVRAEGAKVNAHHWRATKHSRPAPKALNLGTPVSLSLPRLGIDLTLRPGEYDYASKWWVLDNTHAFYVLPGMGPLHSGAEPFIYGHYRRSVFENLSGAATGEPLFIVNKSGKTLAFKMAGSRQVDPADGAIINRLANDHNSINLMTCVSPFFTKREIYHFEYVGVKVGTTVAKG